MNQRILGCRRINRVAERQVDDVSVQPRLVRNRELERVDDIAGLALALVVEDLDPDEANLRGDALELVVRQNAAAPNQSGDVRSMAVVVVRSGRPCPALREIEEAGDAPAKVGTRRDARIDDDHADAARTGQRRRSGLLGQPERFSQRARRKGARRRGGLHQARGRLCTLRAVRIDEGVERERGNFVPTRELADVLAVNFRNQRVDGRVLRLNHVAVVLQALAHLSAIARFERNDDVLGCRPTSVQRLAQRAVNLRRVPFRAGLCLCPGGRHDQPESRHSN